MELLPLPYRVPFEGVARFRPAALGASIQFFDIDIDLRDACYTGLPASQYTKSFVFYELLKAAAQLQALACGCPSAKKMSFREEARIEKTYDGQFRQLATRDQQGAGTARWRRDLPAGKAIISLRYS
jgi:hypothetical protein